MEPEDWPKEGMTNSEFTFCFIIAFVIVAIIAFVLKDAQQPLFTISVNGSPWIR